MLTKEEFASRLKEAMDKRGMKQADLAKAVEVQPANISTYALGKSFPPIDILAEIAKKLDVSLDWLCGLEAKGLQFHTMGDIAHAIIYILGLFPPLCEIKPITITEKQQMGVHETADYGYVPYYDDVEITVPALVFESGEIRTFFEDLVKMKKLLAENTFDYNFYVRWLNDRIQSLSNISLNQEWEELPS